MGTVIFEAKSVGAGGAGIGVPMDIGAVVHLIPEIGCLLAAITGDIRSAAIPASPDLQLRIIKSILEGILAEREAQRRRKETPAREPRDKQVVAGDRWARRV